MRDGLAIDVVKEKLASLKAPERRGQTGLVAAIKQCTKTRDLEGGRKLHEDAAAASRHTDKYVATLLITMYRKCHSMSLAREVFDGMIHRDVVSWNCLLVGYVENGKSSVAMDLFASMECEPDHATYVTVLKACAGLASERESDKQIYLGKGTGVHRELKERGFDSDIVVASNLVYMYSKCGSMELARKVFDRMVRKDVVTWTCLINGYVENGESSVAIELFTLMDSEPNHVTYIAVFKACAALACEKPSERQIVLEKGIGIHRQLEKSGLDTDISVLNSLLNMYSKCGSMQNAREVFDRMICKDVVTWTCPIMGYVENGESSVSLELFASMDCEPNTLTYVGVLKACASLATEKSSNKQTYLDKGVDIHNEIKVRGFDTDIVVSNTLLDMYSKCGSMSLVRQVFDGMVTRDVVTWNCLLTGYVENGENSMAMDLFTCINCEPDHVTYIALLKACAGLASERKSEKPSFLEKGIGIHKQIKDRGYTSHITVANTLLDMYSKCGGMQHARDVFNQMIHPNTISWNSLIMGYLENGESVVALELFTSMDCEWDHVTYVAALKACGSLAALPVGQVIHTRVCKHGLEQDQVLATALVDLYGKCSRMDRGEEVFNSMCAPNIVSWTSLMGGYASLGESSRVFHLAKEIHGAGLKMDWVTYMCILMCCSHAGKVEEGKKYLDSMYRHDGISPGLEHYTCMADMLARANRLDEALSLINSMPCVPDTVIWTSLLEACRRWKNLQVGKAAFDALVASNSKDSAAFVLMSDIYRYCG